jgi:putative membrane protein
MSAPEMVTVAAGDRRDRLGLSVIAVLSVLIVVVVALLLLGRPAPAARDVSALPTLNAVLNGTSAVLLAAGYLCIARRRVTAHKRCMLAAFVVSMLFLVSYVVYHYHAGSKPFGGHGALRVVYLSLLLTHIVLAAVIVPFALTTLYRGLRGQYRRHVRVARWTLPMWLYVSVTGVIVFWMLYRLGG